MSELNDLISIKEFNDFFNKFKGKDLLKNVKILLEKLLEKINFDIKINNGSIHLLRGKETFLACGFRRSKDYYFIEFISEKSINDTRITKEIIIKDMKRNLKIKERNNDHIIYQVEINNGNDIDNKIINWIVKSYKLV